MKITVSEKKTEYEVVIGKGFLSSFGERFSVSGKTLIVSDDGVPQKYAEEVAKGLKSVYKFVITQGEGSKNLKNFSDVLAFMLENGFERTDNVVAVGGGVVGDLAGFVAASYMRGVNFYNVPTTFLSEVDSSIGGKTAIDFCGVKNSVGAFYPPKGVLIDTDTLKTLGKRQLSSGIAESVKMAATFDKELFSLLENTDDFERDAEEIIRKSLEIKKRVVENDFKETGLRRALNFGHTVGHAIESACFPRLLHGECVALGMLVFSSEEVRERLLKVYKKYSLPTFADFSADGLLPFIEKDKKAAGDKINVVYCEEIGSFGFGKSTPREITDTVKEVFSK